MWGAKHDLELHVIWRTGSPKFEVYAVLDGDEFISPTTSESLLDDLSDALVVALLSSGLNDAMTEEPST